MGALGLGFSSGGFGFRGLKSLPRGSIYATIMDLGPSRLSCSGFGDLIQ